MHLEAAPHEQHLLSRRLFPITRLEPVPMAAAPTLNLTPWMEARELAHAPRER
jgi:hypothetical protein